MADSEPKDNKKNGKVKRSRSASEPTTPRYATLGKAMNKVNDAVDYFFYRSHPSNVGQDVEAEEESKPKPAVANTKRKTPEASDGGDAAKKDKRKVSPKSKKRGKRKNDDDDDDDSDDDNDDEDDDDDDKDNNVRGKKGKRNKSSKPKKGKEKKSVKKDEQEEADEDWGKGKRDKSPKAKKGNISKAKKDETKKDKKSKVKRKSSVSSENEEPDEKDKEAKSPKSKKGGAKKDKKSKVKRKSSVSSANEEPDEKDKEAKSRKSKKGKAKGPSKDKDGGTSGKKKRKEKSSEVNIEKDEDDDGSGSGEEEEEGEDKFNISRKYSVSSTGSRDEELPAKDKKEGKPSKSKKKKKSPKDTEEEKPEKRDREEKLKKSKKGEDEDSQSKNKKAKGKKSKKGTQSTVDSEDEEVKNKEKKGKSQRSKKEKQPSKGRHEDEEPQKKKKPSKKSSGEDLESEMGSDTSIPTGKKSKPLSKKTEDKKEDDKKRDKKSDKKQSHKTTSTTDMQHGEDSRAHQPSPKKRDPRSRGALNAQLGKSRSKNFFDVADSDTDMEDSASHLSFASSPGLTSDAASSATTQPESDLEHDQQAYGKDFERKEKTKATAGKPHPSAKTPPVPKPIKGKGKPPGGPKIRPDKTTAKPPQGSFNPAHQVGTVSPKSAPTKPVQRGTPPHVGPRSPHQPQRRAAQNAEGQRSTLDELSNLVVGPHREYFQDQHDRYDRRVESKANVGSLCSHCNCPNSYKTFAESLQFHMPPPSAAARRSQVADTSGHPGISAGMRKSLIYPDRILLRSSGETDKQYFLYHTSGDEVTYTPLRSSFQAPPSFVRQGR